MRRRAGALLAVFALLTLSACDKLKSLAGGSGGSAEGGAEKATKEPSGILSFLGGEGFEGELTIALSGEHAEKMPKTLVYGIKKPKLRVDFVGAAPAFDDNPVMGRPTWMLIDPPARKIHAMSPADKKAMVIDLDKMKEMKALAGGGGGRGGVPTPPKVEKTGKTDTIAGYGCEEWRVTETHGISDVCVADGVDWIDPMSAGSTELGWSAALGVGHFPLRVITRTPEGVEKMRMVVTKIDKKALDASRFVVPADYQVIDPFAMLGRLKGLKGIPQGLPTNAPNAPPNL